jgi:hypothetical protein
MILFYTEKITPRVDYTVRLFFESILKTNVVITENHEEFIRSELPKINYSEKKSVSGISVKPYGLLTHSKIENFSIPEDWFSSEKTFFTPGKTLPFDIFSAAFYLVSRYEEYVIAERDQFGRFKAEASVLYSSKLLKKPLVNIWAERIAESINQEYPGFIWPERKFSFLSTVDIDNAWAIKNKGFVRTSGALLKSIGKANFRDFMERIQVLSGLAKDPYFNYDYLNSVFAGGEGKVIFFFLLGDYNRFDKGISYKNQEFRKLIREISGKYKTGIHPSFFSATDNSGKVQQSEKARLEEITGKPVEISRQHYLKISFPETQRTLIKNGILIDYSLGFASQIGFRAGICTPFYFYDLENESQTNLKIVPFQVMDVTLRRYLEYSPAKATDEILELMEEVRKVKGTFVSVWHNESVSDTQEWKGWRKVFETMNQKGFGWANA